MESAIIDIWKAELIFCKNIFSARRKVYDVPSETSNCNNQE